MKNARTFLSLIIILATVSVHSIFSVQFPSLMVYWCLGIFNDFLKALFNQDFIAGSCRNKTSIEFHHYLYLGLSAQLLRNQNLLRYVTIVTQTPPVKAKNLIFICTLKQIKFVSLLYYLIYHFSH